MSLIYEIADEYLPDKNVYGIDSPDVLLAEEIVCKVLDKAIESVEGKKRNTKNPELDYYLDDYLRDSNLDIAIEAIQALKEGK